jgi:hypothetical protein
MFNIKKKDAVAEEVAKILAQEAELSPKQKKIAKIAGDKEKIDAADLAALRAGKKPVEEGFDDMDKYLKDKNKPQPSGGAGKKQGSKYGGSKQKEEPKEDMKEDVESVDEKAPPGFEGTVKAMKKHKNIDNPFALAWSMKNKGYKSHKKADGSMKKEEVELQTEEDLDEAVSRKHFQQVADLIKTHDDAGKRKELAQHHAEIFKQQNPRFDHAKFMKAAGVNEDVEHVEEKIDPTVRTKDVLTGTKSTKQKDDVGPGADNNSTKVKFVPEENIEEASYSAKAARAGKDIGKPGKEFSKISKSAGERYGSEEAGKRVAGSILAKLREKKK